MGGGALDKTSKGESAVLLEGLAQDAKKNWRTSAVTKVRKKSGGLWTI
jgi:hypothetical protein